MTDTRPAVVLIGFMGAGKSAVGRLLADRLGVAFTDSDAVIEADAGRTIADIFATDGEPAFRDLEHRTIARLLTEPVGVLALGGGAAMHPGTQALLRRHPMVVHLRIDLDRARARTGDDTRRPMLRRADLAEIHARRMPVFDAIATLVLDTADRSLEQVADVVLAAVASAPQV
ncbi:MAG: shikimate kinase [Kineosporiaceae bacterium]